MTSNSSTSEASDRQDDALVELGRALQRSQYKFVTVTPATHELVLSRAKRQGVAHARDVRDVLGWNLPFDADLLPADMLACLERADALEEQGKQLRAKVRFSTLGSFLFVHSSFPTEDENAVFFGPDTYRFARFVLAGGGSPRRIVEVGCGTGAGAIVLSSRKPERIVLSDINPKALAFARVNAALAGVQVEIVQSDVLDDVTGEHDLIIANPPYMQDDANRTYRHGGGSYGEALSVRIVRESLPRLAASGTLMLYTGAPVVDGVDVFHEAVQPLLAASKGIAQVEYEELDPDVFGEQLASEQYAKVERIAVVGLTVRAAAR